MEQPSWYPRWRTLCDRLAKNGYSSLSGVERVWVNVRALIDSTNNGGLISFFYNSYADTLPDCLEALETLGASDVHAQVQRVCKLFGKSVPLNTKERNEVINSWPDRGSSAQALDELLNEIDQFLYERFDDLEARLEAFLARAGIAT